LHAEGGERWSVETIDYGPHQPRGAERVIAELPGEAIETSGGAAQDLVFCAAISDLQLAENLFMSRPALTQSFISCP
jgi:hypothetical protein